MVIRASTGAPFNFANHQMLAVIGTNHDRHALQWAYGTVGRLTNGGRRSRWQPTTSSPASPTYAVFLDQVPWYEFPYAANRHDLMAARVRRHPLVWSAIRLRIRLFDQAGLCRRSSNRRGCATSDPALLDIHVWAKDRSRRRSRTGLAALLTDLSPEAPSS